ncbi:selenium metabolism-associated LysR family transcriptional regulator [Desulforhopalus sp. IMCC35007]|uniref:selenium metabolism-associated LysR family transcriptional regulator n=1 Tax=Desulforhopalus sp. IMCC35007 TaxID=2569543 RepID=UPI00210F5927|nr:selenium metabolism-associated LysR family transcriptional regulator [Desulforhopalus sp. IMCC35007]
MKIFVTVYRTRSFTKAAEELYTSQPTVSEHIQNLETRLGCKLFDRLGRTILPTPEADLLNPRALAILDDLQQLQYDIVAARTSISGDLILGASTIPGTYLIPHFAASFKKKYPAISFEVRIKDSKKIIDAVARNELYLGIVGAMPQTSKVAHEPFVEDDLVLAASKDYGGAAEITIAGIKTLPLIVREQGSGTRKSTELLLANEKVNLRQLSICATLGSSAAVKEAIKANLGVSIISRHAIAEDLKNGELKEITVEGLTMKRHFYIVTPAKRSLPHQYNIFLQNIRQQQM